MGSHVIVEMFANFREPAIAARICESGEIYRLPCMSYMTARPDALIHACPASVGSPDPDQTGVISQTVTRARSPVSRETSERAIAACMIFTSILNMPPDSFTVPTCWILAKSVCGTSFHHIYY